MAQKTNNGLLWGILIILVVLGVIYFNTQNTATEDEVDTGSVEIGVILPLTGDSASYGIAIQQAYDLAAEQLNANGGIDGRMVELVYENGKCDGTTATTAAQKLINIDEVVIILSGTCSSETLAAAELTQAARVLLLTSATSSDISDAGDLVFRTYPADDFESALMAKYADETLGYDRVALISENTDFAQTLRQAFIPDWIARENNVVFDEAFETEETDFRTLLTKLKAANPQAVYVIPESLATGELVLKQLQELRVSAKVFAAKSMFDSLAFAENPSLYEGVVLSEVKIDEENEVTAGMIESYEEKYGSTPEFADITASAYDSFNLVTEAMMAGNMTAEAIAAYFNESISDWEGSLGTFNFDENGDALIDLNLVEVKSGELVEIE
jgi:branched-chain amino acid transport system substrate-binding protein